MSTPTVTPRASPANTPGETRVQLLTKRLEQVMTELEMLLNASRPTEAEVVSKFKYFGMILDELVQLSRKPPAPNPAFTSAKRQRLHNERKLCKKLLIDEGDPTEKWFT